MWHSADLQRNLLLYVPVCSVELFLDATCLFLVEPSVSVLSKRHNPWYNISQSITSLCTMESGTIWGSVYIRTCVVHRPVCRLHTQATLYIVDVQGFINFRGWQGMGPAIPWSSFTIPWHPPCIAGKKFREPSLRVTALPSIENEMKISKWNPGHRNLTAS